MCQPHAIGSSPPSSSLLPHVVWRSRNASFYGWTRRLLHTVVLICTKSNSLLFLYTSGLTSIYFKCRSCSLLLIILWYSLEWPWKAGNYLGTGIEIVFVLPWTRILDRKPGVSGSQVSSSIVSKWTRLISSISTQPAQVNNNENVLNRQTWEGIPVSHPA